MNKSATYTIDEKTGCASFYVSRSSLFIGTFHADHIKLDAKAATAEANNIVQGAHTKFLSTLTPKRIVEAEEVEEREWDSIVSKPHVKHALRRMAAEARRQYYAGETKEGGFGVE